jgi:hypothetical protein
MPVWVLARQEEFLDFLPVKTQVWLRLYQELLVLPCKFCWEPNNQSVSEVQWSDRFPENCRDCC